MAFLFNGDIKINKQVMDDITDGRTTGNSLIRNLENYGERVAAQASENTLTAPNHAGGHRRQRWRDGEAGREETGRLASSYRVQTIRSGRGGSPEIRIGSEVEYFIYHEFGTDQIREGRMLRNALQDITGVGGRIRRGPATTFG